MLNAGQYLINLEGISISYSSSDNLQLAKKKRLFPVYIESNSTLPISLRLTAL